MRCVNLRGFRAGSLDCINRGAFLTGRLSVQDDRVSLSPVLAFSPLQRRKDDVLEPPETFPSAFTIY